MILRMIVTCAYIMEIFLNVIFQSIQSNDALTFLWSNWILPGSRPLANAVAAAIAKTPQSFIPDCCGHLAIVMDEFSKVH